MGNHENFEAIKSADSTHEAKHNLSAYIMERPTPGQSGRDKNSGLVEQGILPSMDIMEFKANIGPEAKPSELKAAGVKVEHTKDGHTKVDYPSGVKVESTGVTQSEKGNIKVETAGNIVEAVPPNTMNKKGEVVDPKGRVIAKPNEDGSITVDSGKGFFTQNQDGTIESTAAIRSRDGKTFEVLDTNNPLGNLRPSDMTNHK